MRLFYFFIFDIGEKDKDVEGLKSMADILSSFMQKSSGLEGVEFAEYVPLLLKSYLHFSFFFSSKGIY